MNIEEIRARTEAATPGPWMWDMRTNSHMCKLVTTHSGQYYVMGFNRWGMQSACPEFQVYDRYSGKVTERGSHGMVRADKLAKSYPGKEHHKGFDDYIDHPDAQFIAHAREDIPALLAEIKRLTAELSAKDEELKQAVEMIERIHRSLDIAEEQRQKSRDYTELAVNNGLALGSIAIAVDHWEWRGRKGGK